MEKAYEKNVLFDVSLREPGRENQKNHAQSKETKGKIDWGLLKKRRKERVYIRGGKHTAQNDLEVRGDIMAP